MISSFCIYYDNKSGSDGSDTNVVQSYGIDVLLF